MPVELILPSLHTHPSNVPVSKPILGGHCAKTRVPTNNSEVNNILYNPLTFTS